MIGAGLSLEQAPPFEATGRFFLSVPIFIIMAGLILVFKDLFLVRSDPSIVAFIHLFTLGVFTMVMFGAIGQMLPVLAGVSIPNTLMVSRLSHTFLIAGTLLFVYGFLSTMTPLISLISGMFLLTSFFLVLGTSLYALINTQKFSPTVKAIFTAMIAGLFTSFLGVWLLTSYAGKYSEVHATIMSIHMVWGIFGFAGVLIIGVSFKIIPMFYVAPEFKTFCTKWVVPLIVIGLILWSVFSFFLPELKWLALLVIATFFFAFSVTVIKKLNQGRRPISDVTIWYWKFAGVNLFIGMLVWIIYEFMSLNLDVYLAVCIGGGFILSILTGMLYKIVPFLVWFHLNAKGHFEIPTMREMISAKIAKIQFVFHVLSLILVLGALSFPYLIQLAGLAFIISGILMMVNLLKAVRIYLKYKDIDPNVVFKTKEP
ncbi:hypothetical protein JHD50_02695 [Sulfurimonas sp. MAG313]|nr:hypothetical protein [Sulfurimonas sp. MAG313]MDF1880219.1 hypothetical protein [Sulfurimonas sp. MAG313]